MTIQGLWLTELRIPFKTTFRHASAERSETSSIWVEARSGGVSGYGEACPRPYVTGETIDSARFFFQRFSESVRHDIVDLHSLRGWIAAHAAEIDESPAAWCAMELACTRPARQRSRPDDRCFPVAAPAHRMLSLHGRPRRRERHSFQGDRGRLSAIGVYRLQGEVVWQPGPRPRQDGCASRMGSTRSESQGGRQQPLEERRQRSIVPALS